MQYWKSIATKMRRNHKLLFIWWWTEWTNPLLQTDAMSYASCFAAQHLTFDSVFGNDLQGESLNFLFALNTILFL